MLNDKWHLLDDFLYLYTKHIFILIDVTFVYKYVNTMYFFSADVLLQTFRYFIIPIWVL